MSTQLSIEDQIAELSEYIECIKKHNCEPKKTSCCVSGGLQWKNGTLQQCYYIELFFLCGYYENTERFDAWLNVPQV